MNTPSKHRVFLSSVQREFAAERAMLVVARLKEDHASYPTNLLLAEILYQAGYIERFGTGTGEMYRLCAEAGLPMREVELDEGFRIRFRKKKVKATPHETAHETAHDILKIADLPHRLACVLEGEMTRDKMMERLKLEHRMNFTRAYLRPALKKGLLEMTLPDKPTSRNQRYRLTIRGKSLKSTLTRNTP